MARVFYIKLYELILTLSALMLFFKKNNPSFKESPMDKAIMDFMREYHLLVRNFIVIASVIVGFVCVSGCIRFGIAIHRRKKGIYPPATSQMEH